MSGVAVGIAAGAAVIGTGYSIYSGERAASAQADAQNQAKEAALKQEKAAKEATNKANAKTPDTNAIMAAAQQAAKSGASGTMLTGPGGASPLNLGKTSLLGG